MPPTCKDTDPYDPADRLYPVATCPMCYVEVPGIDGDYSCRSARVAWNRRAKLAAPPRPYLQPAKATSWELPVAACMLGVVVLLLLVVAALVWWP